MNNRFKALLPVHSSQLILLVGVALLGSKAIASSTIDFCQQLQKTYSLPANYSCNELFANHTSAQSVNNQPLFAFDFPADNDYLTVAERPRILLINGVHGNEQAANWVGLQWLKTLHQQTTFADWRVLPLINPDGALASPPTRFNANGVDLNRNFMPPSGNQHLALNYWLKNNLAARYFPGRRPFNQPESQFIKDHIQSFNPTLIITLHTPHGFIDFDGPSDQAPEQIHHLNQGFLAAVPGSLGNYAWHVLGIPVLTIEFNNQIHQTYQQQYFWLDLLNWLYQSNNQSLPSSSQAKVFNLALKHLINQQFSQAERQFSSISDTHLSQRANNNLAYISIFNNDIRQAQEYLQKNLTSGDETIATIAKHNLNLLNDQAKQTSKVQRLSQFQLLYLPDALQQLENQTNNLEKQIKKLIYAPIVGDQRTYQKLFINPPAMPEVTADYAIIEGIDYAPSSSTELTVSDIYLSYLSSNKRQQKTLRLVWVRQDQQWLIQQIHSL